MTIAQVRLDHYDTFEMSKGELLDWAEKVLKPAAKAAIQGEGKTGYRKLVRILSG